MRLFGNLLVHGVAILIGYGFAVLAVALFLSFGYYREVMAGSMDGYEQELAIGSLSIGFFGLYLGAIISWVAALPSALMILLAEMMRWRSFSTYLVLGALCALFSGLSTGQNLDVGASGSSTLIILLASGFIGGVVYWVVAGRSAGRWIPKSHESV